MKKLPMKWVEHLMKLPETGMGYQHCIITDHDGEHSVLVFNCEEIGSHTPLNIYSITSITVVTK